MENKFSPEIVELLNIYQQERKHHPYTCNGDNIPECKRNAASEARSKGVEVPYSDNNEGLLRATTEGWICPCGKYTQDWYLSAPWTEAFNKKYAAYLKEGHYGLAVNDEEFVKWLDKRFEDFIQIPSFKYMQIKMKWNEGRFYCEGLDEDEKREVEDEISKLGLKSNDKKPKVGGEKYIGIRPPNKSKIWYECNDGTFRCHLSQITLTKKQIEQDVRNDCLKKLQT